VTKAPELTLAVCQLTSTDDVKANVAQMLGLLNDLSDDVDLVCFPENCLYFRVEAGEQPPRLKLDDPSIQKLSGWAKQNGIPLHLGSVPIEDSGRLFNASLLLQVDGSVEVVYKKIHLFDVDVEGVKPQRESDVFAHGSDPSVFTIKGWQFGSSICYDLRFSELFNRYARQGVDVVLVPSAFLVETGRAHWHVLLRARAIESQAFVAAAAQGGTHKGHSGGTRSTYGHALVVEPWGEIISEVKDAVRPQALVVKLQAERVESVRRQIPMKAHRRL
jgi:deaminated glutathione amidase